MTDIFAHIAIILAAATIFAAIFSRFRQPLMLSYILVGVLAASSGFFKGASGASMDFLSELGIAFALFLIGLELRFSDIKQISRAAIFVGAGQVILAWFFGFFLVCTLGFRSLEAFYLSLALTFSSTIIVVKLLSEKRDLDSLYGKITVGYLIVQDFIAIAALILLASFGHGKGTGGILTTLLEGVFLVALILVLNRFVLQGLFDLLAKNTEVLFLAGVSWALVFAAATATLGFSIEIGAFLAGLGLANLREEHQIAARVRPLRDLFVTLFFLSLGLRLSVGTISSILVPTIVLSLFVLVGSPLIVMVIAGLLGFRRRTAFHIAVTSAQVSEFSLILIALSRKLGLVSENVVNITTATALLTIVLSTYLIAYSSKIYRLVAAYLKIFERKTLVEQLTLGEQEFSDHVVLVGAGRLGANILRGLREKGFTVVVVDFDPKVVKRLQEENISVIYGDVSDPEISERAFGKNPKMIISTVFDHEDSEVILREVKNLPQKPPVITTAAERETALELYREGATYVIIPRLLSSHLVERLLLSGDFEDLINGTLRKEHLAELNRPALI